MSDTGKDVPAGKIPVDPAASSEDTAGQALAAYDPAEDAEAMDRMVADLDRMAETVIATIDRASGSGTDTGSNGDQTSE